MRVPLLCANWKMNKTIPDALSFVGEFVPQMLDLLGDGAWPEVVICPPFTAIPAMTAVLSGFQIGVGAQDVHFEEKGAYTGEISPGMLRDAGCSYAIIGHSERRQLMGETDLAVKKKVRSALDAGLRPIMCAGETLEEREQGETHTVAERMVREGFADVKPDEVASTVIAYEPVWAIGTGKEAKPDDEAAVIGFIRSVVDSMFPGTGESVRVLYGGSVKSGNIRSFMAKGDIDGALVGGASLDPDEFAKMLFEVIKGRPKR